MVVLPQLCLPLLLPILLWQRPRLHRALARCLVSCPSFFRYLFSLCFLFVLFFSPEKKCSGLCSVVSPPWSPSPPFSSTLAGSTIQVNTNKIANIEQSSIEQDILKCKIWKKCEIPPPERPIMFLSLCYLLISLGYLLRWDLIMTYMMIDVRMIEMCKVMLPWRQWCKLMTTRTMMQLMILTITMMILRVSVGHQDVSCQRQRLASPTASATSPENRLLSCLRSPENRS